jgi:hypothetical protein
MSTGALAGLSIGSSLIGGIMQGEGAKNQYEAQSQMYSYQSQVAKINSQIDLQNADFARQTGEMQAQNFGMQAGQRMGQIKAAQGASNIAVNSGSNAQVQKSQQTVTTLDLDQIRSNAAKTAYDYDVQSTQDLNQAGLYGFASSNAAAAAPTAMAASLVSTAGSVSSKWLQGTQSGAIPAIMGASGGGSGGINPFNTTGSLY